MYRNYIKTQTLAHTHEYLNFYEIIIVLDHIFESSTQLKLYPKKRPDSRCNPRTTVVDLLKYRI